MKEINELTKIKNKIKLIIFDVDGVLVPRGTNIKTKNNTLTLQIKKIDKLLIEDIKELSKKYSININSGRGLYMLQEMFREILPYVSLTYENGSATWYKGKIVQHINSFDKLKNINSELLKIKNKQIKGFEPKEFIITIHCYRRVKSIEKIANQKGICCLWNGEAYDIGLTNQTKSNGVKFIRKHLNIRKENTLAIGDNYNDLPMLNEAGIKITTDKKRLAGDYYINTNKIPASILIKHLK